MLEQHLYHHLQLKQETHQRWDPNPASRFHLVDSTWPYSDPSLELETIDALPQL